MSSEIKPSSNFIKTIIDKDLNTGKISGGVVTRFPPEPNGYLHIGHAKSICLNFGLATVYNGICHLRFDDTNPVKEDTEYIESIKKDIRWLGFNWDKHEYYASDYFEKLYNYAVELIKKGLAYVCSLSPDEVRAYRGTLTETGKNSPFRDRSCEENLFLFEKMKKGGFEEGSHVLRAKIDMASPNLNMRDPAIYRIKKVTHHKTGDKWCIYPMYDFAHVLSDAIEGITHSICTLEFEDHRALYNWFLEKLNIKNKPQQIEFARLNLKYTIMSKRNLLTLVEQKHVESWDDPRMPTIAGMKKRGYPAQAIKNFCDIIGVGKSDSLIDISVLEDCVRNYLNETAPRVMCVLNPIKIVITNYPDNKEEELDAPYMPENFSMGSRKLIFSKELYIEKDDFMEEASKKFYRLSIGREVRLRYAYIIKCEKIIKDDSGKILEIHCTYDSESRGGNPADGRKIKSTLHWVSVKHCLNTSVILYDRLFVKENPSAKGEDFIKNLNPNSLLSINNAKIEPSMKDTDPDTKYQFERIGYFWKAEKKENPFIRISTLRDTWEKIKNK